MLCAGLGKGLTAPLFTPTKAGASKTCVVCGSVFVTKNHNRETLCSDNCKRLRQIQHNIKCNKRRLESTHWHRQNAHLIRNSEEERKEISIQKFCNSCRNPFHSPFSTQIYCSDYCVVKESNKRFKMSGKKRKYAKIIKGSPRHIRTKLSGRINRALQKRYKKASKTMNLVGCSIQSLISHLESNFKPGMSWNNYGMRGWHIDHIRPCASFDLSKSEEQSKCFHYSNLQPLWWRDNIIKSDKWDGQTSMTI